VGSIFFSFGLAVFAAVVLGFRTVLKSARDNWATNWPTASGQITTCDIKVIHGRFIDYALGSIGYSYQTDGDYYSGYLTGQFWDEQQAWTFVDTWKDKSVLVHYKLGKPQISVLREVDSIGALPVRPLHGSPEKRFGPVLAILWSLLNVSDWAQRKLHEEATNWPSIAATVDYAEPIAIDDDAHWGGDFHYSYFAGGRSYSDSYYLRALGEEDARDLVERWRGGKIIVHYFAGNPAKSVFILEEQEQYASGVDE